LAHSPDSDFCDSLCLSTRFLSISASASDDAGVQTADGLFVSTSTGRSSVPAISVQTEPLHKVAVDKTFQLDKIGTLASKMLQELELPQDAFDSLVALGATEHRGVSYKYTLSCESVDSSQLQCVGLSWNATGSMVCAVFGRPDLCGWCDDLGMLCCWSLFRTDFSPGNPTYSAEHNCCLTAVACHPSHPSVLAAGSFNGEILIYDLASSGDFLEACSEVSEYTHREPVTALQWTRNFAVPTSSKDAYWLVSLSGEGRILWWSLKTIEPANAVISGRLPYPVRGATIPAQALGSKTISPAVGGTAMAMDLTGILIGSEGGFVSRFSLKPKAKLHTAVAIDEQVRWEKAADDILRELPPDSRTKVRKHVEYWANSSRKEVVTAKDIFASRPKSNHIFPFLAKAVTEFEAHAGATVLMQSL